MLFLQSLFLANAALSQPHAAHCLTGVQISEFVFSCFTAGYLKGWEEKKQRNFYSCPIPRSAPSWSERVKLGKVRQYRLFFPSWSQALTILQLFNSLPVLLHMDQSKARKGIQWEGEGTQCSVPAFTSHLLETGLLMAMESSTDISTNKTQLFKHYYLLWLHANLMRQWDFQWRKSHSFALVHKRLIQEVAHQVVGVVDKCV